MADDEDDGERRTQRRGGGMAALWERVDNHSSMIRSLAEETASQFRDFRAETAAQIHGVSTSIDKLATKLDGNAASLAESQRPQYLGLFGAMVAAVGLSVTIIQWQTSLHDKPVDDKLASLTLAISELTKNTTAAFSDAAKSVVSNREFQETLAFQKELGDVRTAYRDQQRALQQAQIDKLNADVVSRPEHVLHWAAADKSDERLQGEIDRLTRRLDEITPASEVLKTLSEREHELEMRVFGQKPVP